MAIGCELFRDCHIYKSLKAYWFFATSLRLLWYNDGHKKGLKEMCRVTVTKYGFGCSGVVVVILMNMATVVSVVVMRQL